MRGEASLQVLSVYFIFLFGQVGRGGSEENGALEGEVGRFVDFAVVSFIFCLRSRDG